MQKEPHNIHQAHMGKVCEICGDIGYKEAIITCYWCKNVDVHQYCVLGYYEDAPVDWCCEECAKSNASAKICQSTIQLKKHSKFPGLYFHPIDVALFLGPGGSTIMEHRSSDAVNESRRMNSSMTHPCDPALVPSWKGSFDVLGPEFAPGIFNNSIQDHPLPKVRRKVYAFTGVLPDTLTFELVPRGDIWASLFKNHCPGKEDIGLYFFASERERPEIYISLVEFMRINDLVMRTVINDVELLILASTTLCSDSQRWNDEHFLWGLFCHIGQDTDGCAEDGGDKVIDTEIDMIAGENVGTPDIVVSTAARKGFDTVVTPQVDLEDTSAATMDTHTQQESDVLRRSNRVRTPSTRLAYFVAGGKKKKRKVATVEHLIN